jgi:tetratricopeptide (TPR) repeat protein
MKKNFIYLSMAIMLLALAAMPAWSQAVLARVQGTIKDNGKPLAGVQVSLTNEDNGRQYKAKTDKNGGFDLIGIATSNNYRLEVFSTTGEKLVTRGKLIINNEGGGITMWAIDVSDQSKTNLGMTNEGAGTKPRTGGSTGPTYTKEQIEAMKAQNAKAVSQNALITQAINAMNAKQWQEAVPPLQQLIAADPNRYEFYQSLGEAQFNLGQFEDSVQTFEKGIQVANNTAVDPKNPATDPVKKKTRIAAMYTNEGNALLKLKKSNEAVAAFTKAAEMDPNPSVAYFNLCATQYNAGQVEGALAACDKAIAADPNRADAYFIKGSLLIAESKTDKEGKLQPPPGTSDALNKYLELQPDGPHANDVKQMLAAIGAKIETTYREKKKK